MTPAIDPDGREEIQELFDDADADGDQRIDFAEFCRLLADLDPGMEPEALEIGFREIDTDRDRRIDCAEFLAWWADR
jgi:Ca2+-binding EF-hand superfamily protein